MSSYFFVLWLSNRCKCPLTISALQLTSISARVRFVFSFKKKLHFWDQSSEWTQLPSTSAIVTDGARAASGCSGQVWRKVRVNDVREWRGGLLGGASPAWTTPLSTTVTSSEALALLFASKVRTLSREALYILTFGDLRIFWQLLKPGTIFSEICLASLCNLSFRPRHNYSCFGSILATVTVPFLGCYWRLLCPSQWRGHPWPPDPGSRKQAPHEGRGWKASVQKATFNL